MSEQRRTRNINHVAVWNIDLGIACLERPWLQAELAFVTDGLHSSNGGHGRGPFPKREFIK